MEESLAAARADAESVAYTQNHWQLLSFPLFQAADDQAAELVIAHLRSFLQASIAAEYAQAQVRNNLFVPAVQCAIHAINSLASLPAQAIQAIQARLTQRIVNVTSLMTQSALTALTNKATRAAKIALAGLAALATLAALTQVVRFPRVLRLPQRVVGQTETGSDVAEMVPRRWQIDTHSLLGLKERLRQRVLGQTEAVGAVAKICVRFSAGLARRQQPIGSFLFLGSTSVGKNKLVKALVEELFGDDTMLVRFSMFTYMNQLSVARLIGDAPGYVGHEEEGKLIDVVRRSPYSVLLFDEVEKAHPNVLEKLFQVLDNGQLTDGQGQTVDFSHTIIFMTSKLGAQNLLGELSFEDARNLVMKEVQNHFDHKLLSRLDKIVVFRVLIGDALKQVVQLQINDVIAQLVEKRVAISFTGRALDNIRVLGYNPIYGARSITTWLEMNVVDKLSEMMIDGDISENSIVSIDLDGDLDADSSGVIRMRLRINAKLGKA